ncbi:MAG: phosphoribosyltransferase family protein [Candidatus Doudnabacteria bacterium]|nr:phosphoribosyltransferase family protein [Candidatus Doudnabacteria bacterium]
MDVQTEVLEILKKTGAVIMGSHIVGTSGRHMSVYINKDYLLPHPVETSRICFLLARQHKNLDVDIVAAPVVAGAILGHEVARHLSEIQGKEILSAYADKTDEGPLVFKRGYDELIKGKRVLVIEDTVATGLSVHKMIDVVKKYGGRIQQMGVLVNRVPKEINSETLGVPFSALCEIPAETFAEKDCPMCKAGVPINTKVGHGKKYLEAKV